MCRALQQRVITEISVRCWEDKGILENPGENAQGQEMVWHLVGYSSK